MANMNKLYFRTLSLLQIINSQVSNTATIKHQYKYLRDQECCSDFALDKAFSRDIRLLCSAELICKNGCSIKPMPRLGRVMGLLKPLKIKQEILKIYIHTTHERILDNEHESQISKNLLLLDSFILEPHEKKDGTAA